MTGGSCECAGLTGLILGSWAQPTNKADTNGRISRMKKYRSSTPAEFFNGFDNKNS